jgi:hypothetical protein
MLSPDVGRTVEGWTRRYWRIFVLSLYFRYVMSIRGLAWRGTLPNCSCHAACVGAYGGRASAGTEIVELLESYALLTTT